MKKLTICACASRAFIEKDKVARLAAVATQAGWDVSIVADFCEMVADQPADAVAAASGAISACHERAVKSLSAAAVLNCQRQNPDQEIVAAASPLLLNNRTDSVEAQLEALGIDAAAFDEEETERLTRQMAEQVGQFVPRHGEDAWFPNIDKDACCECGKCFDFCPFGVYEKIEDKVRVVHPHNCKNNCPSCARHCPVGAIVFPKYDNSPINGGAEQEESAVRLDAREVYANSFRVRLAQRKESVLKNKK